jgi:DNA-binding response OmpR family regulator
MNGPHHCIGDCQRAEAQLARLRAEVEQLTYERDHYQREACQLVDSDRTNLIQERFGLTAEEAVVCAALYQRRDRWLPGNNLEGLLDEYRGGSTEASLVSQMVSRIRRKLGDDAVENARGRGYRMSVGTIKAFDRRLTGKRSGGHR